MLLDPPVVELGPGTVVYRSHRVQDPPRWYGRAMPASGIGLSEDAIHAETLIRDPGRRFNRWTNLRDRAVTQFRALQQLRLARLYGEGLARLGVETQHIVGDNYDICQQLSRAPQLLCCAAPLQPCHYLPSTRARSAPRYGRWPMVLGTTEWAW